MARDYKNASRKPEGAGVPAWLAFTSGLSVGLFVAFLVYLDGRVEPDPGTALPAGRDAPRRAAEAAAAPAADERPVIKPRFDFYTILPEMEVKVPDWKLPGEGQPAGQTGLDPARHVLQVGSFQRFEEADKAKAELALQGIRADIQRVVINGQDVWYRVWIGPFESIEALQDVRARLIEADRDFMLLQIKPGQQDTGRG